MKLLKSKTIQRTILAASVAFLAYSCATTYNAFNTKLAGGQLLASQVTTMKAQSYNETMQKMGFDKVDIDKSKPSVFVIEHKGAFDAMSPAKLFDKLDYIAANADEGDEVVINIASNGGLAMACSSMVSEIDALEDELDLKVTAVVDIAANSCGYMLAASADEIIMSKAARIGNIGTVGGYVKKIKTPTATGIIKGIAGGDTEVVRIGSTRVKELLAGLPAETEEDENVHKFLLSKTSEQFFNYVRESRGGRLKDEKLAFSALYFYYKDALEIGLVDEVGTYRSLMRKMYKDGRSITIVN